MDTIGLWGTIRKEREQVGDQGARNWEDFFCEFMVENDGMERQTGA